jgi:RNA polymerase sigma factor (sigma-70 family)
MTAIEFHNQLLNLEQSLEKFAYRLTLKKADAKDLIQETFLKALMNQDKYVKNENFKAWTFTIMRNTFINNYRRSFHENTRYDHTKESFFITQTMNTGSDNPDSTYSVLEITQNIEQLKDMFRIPFKMHISGFKYKEIADKLNLNIGTVKSRIYLSRKQLMDQLNG